MTHREQIEVIKALRDGLLIQSRNDDGHWSTCGVHHQCNFREKTYRVKPGQRRRRFKAFLKRIFD